MRNKAPKLSIGNEDSTSLNKYISDTGFCSRREADDYIAQGRVTINERPAALGNRVGPADSVEIDGEPIKKKVKPIYIAFNKPQGITSTTDTKDKTSITGYLNFPQRIFPIGRLDKDSEGLIFLTNDGNIVNKMLRAGNNHEKEYVVSVDKPIDREFIEKMSEGVAILGTRTKRCKVAQEAKSVFRITLTQGLNRQVRRMCAALDYKVVRLKRVRIMNVHLGTLPSGQWRALTPEEMTSIRQMMAESSNTEEASVIIREKHLPKAEEKAKRPEKEKSAAKATPAKKGPAPRKEVPKGSFKDYRDKAKKRKG